MAVIAALARVYVHDLDTALATFRSLTGEEPRLRFAYRDLELASIAGFLLVAGTDEALAPYRATHATLLVDSIESVLELAAGQGAEVLDGPNEVPTGRNLTVRHPGGPQLEYVEFHSEARAAAAL